MTGIKGREEVKGAQKKNTFKYKSVSILVKYAVFFGDDLETFFIFDKTRMI